MITKLIYFVRHGETANNAKGVRQGPEGPLSEKGRGQVLATAKRFPKGAGRPQAIIASPYERTIETANIIATELGIKKIEYTDLLKERRNPTEIVGHAGTEPNVKKIVDYIDNSFHDDNLRYADEENFTDLKERARQLLKYITRRPEERMILVTHKIFLKMVVSYMLLGEKLTASEYNNLSYINQMDNAGLAICSYTPHLFKKNEWRLLVWNNLEVR